MDPQELEYAHVNNAALSDLSTSDQEQIKNTLRMQRCRHVFNVRNLTIAPQRQQMHTLPALEIAAQQSRCATIRIVKLILEP